MDLKALGYFAAIAEFGSITRAAQHLRVAQPAVSRKVQKLERDVGAKLLSRTVQGVSLTEQGAHLLSRITPVLAVLKQTRAEIRDWGQEPSGRVSVAIIPGVGPALAPMLVGRLREMFPKVRLNLSEGLGAAISGGVLSGQYDLGLYQADQEPPALHVTHLLDEPMFLIGLADGLDTRADSIDLGGLADYPLLLPEPPNPLRRTIDRLVEERGLELNIRETVNSTSMLKTMVAAGLGYTVQSYSFFHEDMKKGDPTFQALRIDGLMRNWSLVRLQDRPAGGAVLAVAGMIEDIAQELAAIQGWPGAGA
ncbi:MAG: LysR family transcriptional regulator [Rhodospirillales bacterium]